MRDVYICIHWLIQFVSTHTKCNGHMKAVSPSFSHISRSTAVLASDASVCSYKLHELHIHVSLNFLPWWFNHMVITEILSIRSWKMRWENVLKPKIFGILLHFISFWRLKWPSSKKTTQQIKNTSNISVWSVINWYNHFQYVSSLAERVLSHWEVLFWSRIL